MPAEDWDCPREDLREGPGWNHRPGLSRRTLEPARGRLQRRNERLERELGSDTEHARVHVRRRGLPPGDTRNKRRVVEEGGVAVRQIVDVEPRREAPAP